MERSPKCTKSPKKTPKKFQSDPSQPTITGWLSKSPSADNRTTKASALKKEKDHKNKEKNDVNFENIFTGKRQNVNELEANNKSKANSANAESQTYTSHKKSQKREKKSLNSTKEKKSLNITTKKVNKPLASGSEKTIQKLKMIEMLTKGANSARKSKPVTKNTLKRFSSASSDDLPTFREKVPRKRLKQTDSFKKYGVIVPSVDEVIADQKVLSKYKVQVEEAQKLKEPNFKMPTTPVKNTLVDDILDCKHLTLEDISDHFNKNISFLADIVKGKKSSDRHRRYYDKKNVCDRLTVQDLSYSTSSIVFSFEQLDHMVLLMQEKFDPDDTKTCYFFKVLVPELCLKIFMDVHDMNKREATRYLENRPI